MGSTVAPNHGLSHHHHNSETPQDAKEIWNQAIGWTMRAACTAMQVVSAVSIKHASGDDYRPILPGSGGGATRP